MWRAWRAIEGLVPTNVARKARHGPHLAMFKASSQSILTVLSPGAPGHCFARLAPNEPPLGEAIDTSPTNGPLCGRHARDNATCAHRLAWQSRISERLNALIKNVPLWGTLLFCLTI